jgi:alpha-tubulin suppressor-like RCC1 family protein
VTRRVRRLLLLGQLTCALAGCLSDDETSTCSGPTCNSVSGEDSGVEDGSDDAGAEDAGSEPPANAECSSEEGCQNDVYCDGRERCEGGRCIPAGRVPCGSLTCDEGSRRCDCHMDGDGLLAGFCGGPDDDADGDNVSSAMFGGADCDDSDPDRFTGNTELCDYRGHDEDCDPTSTGSSRKEGDPLGDRDDDGYIDYRCINLDPQTMQPVHAREADCDDDVHEIHPGPDSQDFCDDFDNDCDGFTDEIEGSGLDGSARSDYCRDADGDGRGDVTVRRRACAKPIGYVPCESAENSDCDDRQTGAFPLNPEICDGIDNDCDGVTDDPDNTDDILIDRYAYTDGTLSECIDGKWELTCTDDKRWCNRNTFARGCETDATRLGSCRACETACRFSCGATGCDEIVELSLGLEHSCARTGEGRVACWGRGLNGRLGSGDEVATATARLVSGLERAIAIAAGSAHSCAAVDADGKAYCWGSNDHGQLGTLEPIQSSSLPIGVEGDGESRLSDVRRLAAGELHTCAVLNSSEVLCWGDTARGVLGNGLVDVGSVTAGRVRRRLDAPGEPQYEFVTDASDVTLGARHTCLLSQSSAVECWGDNTVGQLGNPGVTEYSADPLRVPDLPVIERIEAGAYHTCALAEGSVYCWGDNSQGQLGRVSAATDGRAVVVPDLPPVAAIACGFASTCVRTTAGAVLCWGELPHELQPDNALGAVPVEVALDPTDAIAVGGKHACGRIEGSPVVCWGANRFGQLGDGSVALDTTEPPRPIQSSSGSLP